MCTDCWARYGSPRIINDRVRRAVVLLDRAYDYSCVGGHLHVVVDDFNIEDNHIKGAYDTIRDYIIDPMDIFGDEQINWGQVLVELGLLQLFDGMSIEERASALALYDGYFKED